MEPLAQLLAWQKQAVGHEKRAADMGVALRLLRHGIEAVAELEKLRAELAEWKATTPAPKPDCRTCSKYLPPIYAFSEPACPRRKISMDPCINGSHYRPADPVRLYETGGE